MSAINKNILREKIRGVHCIVKVRQSKLLKGDMSIIFQNNALKKLRKTLTLYMLYQCLHVHPSFHHFLCTKLSVAWPIIMILADVTEKENEKYY